MRGWLLLVVLMSCETKQAATPDPIAPTSTSTATSTSTSTATSTATATPTPTPNETPTGGGEAPDNLGQHDIMVVVDAARVKVKACYNRALAADPNVEGRIVVRMTIAASGKVADARAADTTTLSDGELKRCIIDVMRGLVFPSASTSTQLQVPFAFVRQTDAGAPAPDAAAPKPDAGKPKVNP